MSNRLVVMLGPSLASPGGMTSVVCTLREAGLFDRCGVHYISTYELPALFRQLNVVARAVVELFLLLIRRRVALVHVHSASRGSFWRKSFFCALAWTCGVPYVFHVHSGEFPVFYHQECGEITQWWVRRTLRKAARVVCLTATWMDCIKKIEPTAEVVVIGNPVAVPEQLEPLRDPPQEVLFLGRLREKKGVNDLVAAIPQVTAVSPQLRFILAGDGELDKVREIAKKLGVEGSIVLPGWVDGDQKATYLTGADIFVLPSYFEGLPVGILEAMACGIPIIATAVGGIPDVIENNVHGILLSPGDVGALARELVRLSSDRELRERLRQAAFGRVQSHYSIAVIAAAVEDLYMELGTGLDNPAKLAVVNSEYR